MKDYTDITIILDESGSMGGVKKDVIGGFNTFLAKQRELGDNASVSLVKFNSRVKTVYASQNVSEAPEMTNENFQPSGWTALFDAIGMTIDAVEARLADMPESERPNKVLFAILTDGQENSSREYNFAKINSMIKHQREAYNWEFVFLGSTLEAMQAGRQISSIQANRTAPQSVAESYTSGFAALSNGVSNLRSYNSMRSYQQDNADNNFFEVNNERTTNS
jgi:hypothetical protein